MTCVNCEGVSELLAAFADGGLEGRERQRVEAHVASCARCGDEVRALREVLVETRRAAAHAAPAHGDDAFWQSLTLDIRVAVAAEPAPRTSWWRMPVMAVAFAAAAAAVLYVYAKGGAPPAAPVVATTHHHRVAPIPPAFDVDDLDASQLAAVDAALSDNYADAPDDDELAASAPGAPETLVENLSDEDAARVQASL